ncbi:hypothetical protein EPUL_000399 [Erysiphe pulchra]|uniref:RNase H type-1 domain-containing protein n=1 Tax=Erysiphe pulchra TaxID=225359 RepID=A0A2S4PW43_9PEZI|nr:hypothetical protein EPUL_000399 [Erysiphe pulchra]
MASVDIDVDMSPPATPTRAPLSPSPRPQTKRFLNTSSTTFASQKSVDLSEDPSHSSTNSQDSTSKRQDTLAVSPGNYLTKATEEAEHSKALDEASGRLRELGLGNLTKSVEAEIALILQQFAKGEKRLGSSQSDFYPTYAQRKSKPKKPNDRIFIRLPEEHASRSHHVYAVKAALTSRLNLEHGSLKTVKKVNSGFAIVPNNDKQAEELLSKANLITTTIRGTVEKGEEWHTHVVENVPRSLMSLDGKKWNVTEENAREEILAATSTMPTKVAWSRKTLDNPATTGTIVAYVENSTPPFTLFCTSSLARKIFKSQKAFTTPACAILNSDARIAVQQAMLHAKRSLDATGRKKEEPVGVLLDPHLSFKHYVATWCAKALKLAQHMLRLNSVKRGAAPKALITEGDSCVVPVATYGAEAWRLGLSRPKANGTVRSPTSFRCGLIDKALHLALRAALPVWRITPNVALHREGGIPPANILLEGYRSRLATRLNSLDDLHPLRIRANICAYSDGSSEGPGRSSCGYILQRGGKNFQKGKGLLHSGEVYDAKIFGATFALRAALSARPNNEKIFVLLDNQAAVMALITVKSISSIRLTNLFYGLAKPVNAEFRWVSDHSRIIGNKEADAEARAALRDLPERQTQSDYITLADLLRYQDLDLKMRRRKPPELALPRWLLHHLLAATGHGDFAAYHRRLNHAHANLECVCGWETTPTHFFRCRQHANQMRKLRNGMNMDTYRRHDYFK